MTENKLIATIIEKVSLDSQEPMPQQLPAAAVLVLCESENNRLLLTKRAQHLKHHPGEICFPGGNYQQSDASLIDTALRETEEEVAIKRNRIKIIGKLENQVSKNRTFVYPFIGITTCFMPLAADLREVDQVISLPLHQVLNPSNYETYFHQVNRMRVKSQRFIHNDYLIWGLTARVMIDFASLYRGDT